MTVTVKALAKINLFLDVVGKRPNGYHDIVSVMQSVSLSDTLTVQRQSGEALSLDTGGALPADEKNLIIRAARAYFAKSGSPFGVSVLLDKRIPMQAGLGGGSADAAAMLKALNTLDGERFTLAELAEIGAGIGADVPFCVYGGTCLCEGIGEVITPVAGALCATVVVAMMGEGVSTPAGFAALDARCSDFKDFTSNASPASLIAALRNASFSDTVSALFNRFEEVVEPQRPAVSRLKEILTAHGAAAQMSGSGPAVFGLFADPQSAALAVAALRAAGARAYLCETVSQ